MKTIAVNGSPRKNWNTSVLLKHALEGATDAGSETELIHLCELAYSGCCSCFACKKKERIITGCAVKDRLTDVLEKIWSCDVLLLGSPIYLGNITGMMKSFLERLIFAYLYYSKYAASNFDVAHKSMIREIQFPVDCQKAYELGKRLASIVQK